MPPAEGDHRDDSRRQRPLALSTTRVKLIIQIPCFNEADHLEATFNDLPRAIPGIREIEVLIVDDGSTDDTSRVARKIGVHHILRFPNNRGLAAAFSAGLDAAVQLGADIVVNTDADNQYAGADIAALVEPIIRGTADVVIGDRQTDTIEHFSLAKRILQRWGSRIVRSVADASIADSPSGFRAFSRHAACRMFVHNRFTYTLETAIQAGRGGLSISNVPVRTNAKARESRLFKSTGQYVRRAGGVILRSYAMYRPVQSFSLIALILLLFGTVLGVRFVYFYLQRPDDTGHVQSLLVGVGCIVLAFLVGLNAMQSELVAANRRLLEDVLYRIRRLESRDGTPPATVESTGALSWSRDD